MVFQGFENAARFFTAREVSTFGHRVALWAVSRMYIFNNSIRSVLYVIGVCGIGVAWLGRLLTVAVLGIHVMNGMRSPEISSFPCSNFFLGGKFSGISLALNKKNIALG